VSKAPPVARSLYVVGEGKLHPVVELAMTMTLALASLSAKALSPRSRVSLYLRALPM